MMKNLKNLSLALGILFGSACANKATDDVRVERQPTQVTGEWLNEIAAAPDTASLLSVLERYDATVTDADKQVLVEQTHDITMSPAFVRLKRADILHELGRYAEAAALYREVGALEEPGIAPSFLGFRRVLAEHGVSLATGVRRADTSLVADLEKVERGLSDHDSFSQDLDYQIAIAGFIASTPDVDRMLRVANAIDLAAVTPSSAKIDASTLSFTIDALTDAGRRADAEALHAKLVRLDATFATGLATNGLGARTLAGR